MSLGKPVVKLHDMDDDMISFAIKNAEHALDVASSELLIANYMKNSFEKTY